MKTSWLCSSDYSDSGLGGFLLEEKSTCSCRWAWICFYRMIDKSPIFAQWPLNIKRALLCLQIMCLLFDAGSWCHPYFGSRLLFLSVLAGKAGQHTASWLIIVSTKREDNGFIVHRKRWGNVSHLEYIFLDFFFLMKTCRAPFHVIKISLTVQTSGHSKEV